MREDFGVNGVLRSEAVGVDHVRQWLLLFDRTVLREWHEDRRTGVIPGGLCGPPKIGMKSVLVLLAKVCVNLNLAPGDYERLAKERYVKTGTALDCQIVEKLVPAQLWLVWAHGAKKYSRPLK